MTYETPQCIDALAMISYMEGLDDTSIRELLQFFLSFVTPSESSSGIARRYGIS